MFDKKIKKELLKKAGLIFLAMLGIDLVVDVAMNFFMESNEPVLTLSSFIIGLLIVVILVVVGAIKVEEKK